MNRRIIRVMILVFLTASLAACGLTTLTTAGTTTATTGSTTAAVTTSTSASLTTGVVTTTTAATTTTAVTTTTAATTTVVTTLRQFTLAQLAVYNGNNGSTAYIAVNGVVYDVTGVDDWSNGWHKGMHLAGTDATAAFDDSPHSLSFLNQLDIVGTLVD